MSLSLPEINMFWQHQYEIYVCMYVCMYVCTYVCTYVCMYVRTCVCMYAYMYVCRYVCMYIFILVSQLTAPHPSHTSKKRDVSEITYTFRAFFFKLAYPRRCYTQGWSMNARQNLSWPVNAGRQSLVTQAT